MPRGCGPAAISRCENRSCSGNLHTASIPGTSSPSSSSSAPSTGRPLPPTTSSSTPSLPWRKTSPSGGMCRKCSTTRQSGLTGRSHGVGARRQRYLTAAGFLLPAAVGICLFSILPIAQALRISFFDYSGLSPQSFLASTTQALPSLVVMSVWKDVGFYMLIFLAGLQAISVELYESAAIDGTTRWQSFTRITLPLLRRAAVFVVVVGTISAFKIFTPVYLMTDGGPADSTMVLVFYIFRTAFRYFEMGYASAMSFILLGIVLVLTIVQFRLLRTTVEY